MNFCRNARTTTTNSCRVYFQFAGISSDCEQFISILRFVCVCAPNYGEPPRWQLKPQVVADHIFVFVVYTFRLPNLLLCSRGCALSFSHDTHKLTFAADNVLREGYARTYSLIARDEPDARSTTKTISKLPFK